jgi:formylmethanofuran dehydrogenase subunit E
MKAENVGFKACDSCGTMVLIDNTDPIDEITLCHPCRKEVEDYNDDV